MTDTGKMEIHGFAPDKIVHFERNRNIPEGVMVAVHENRVVWMGAAYAVPQAVVDSWPGGTIVQVSPTVFEQIKTAAAATGEGRPVQ